MDHSEVQELLLAYANGDLYRPQREFTEAHLANCADCRADLAEYTWVRSQVTSLRDAPITSDIKEATMSTIQATGTVTSPRQGLMRPVLVAAAVVAAIIVPLVLQLSGAGPGAPLAEAYEVIKGLQSYRMSGSTSVTANGETSEGAFEWGFAAPDRYHGRLTTGAEIQSFIIIGSEQYVRDSRADQMSGSVVVITDDASSPIPSREGTLQLLDSLVDVKRLPDEKLDGADSFHYRGRVDIDRMVDEQAASLDPKSTEYQEGLEALVVQRSIKIDVELWIDKGDYSLRQMRRDVTSPTTVSDADGTRQVGSITASALVRYHGFDEPVEIKRPLTSSGDLEDGWHLVGSGPPAPTIVTSERD